MADDSTEGGLARRRKRQRLDRVDRVSRDDNARSHMTVFRGKIW